MAAWRAASLVGSYELLLWLIRTAANGTVVREPTADHRLGSVDQPVTGLWLVPTVDHDLPGDADGPGRRGSHGGPGGGCAGPVIGSGRAGGPDEPGADREYRLAVQEATGWSDVDRADAVGEEGAKDINEAAAAAYRASINSGRPLSERKLAALFGKTSRRWARHRMADARDISEASLAPGR